MAGLEGKKSSIDIINNGTISDDGVVASDVPPRYLLFKIVEEICLGYKIWVPERL